MTTPATSKMHKCRPSGLDVLPFFNHFGLHGPNGPLALWFKLWTHVNICRNHCIVLDWTALNRVPEVSAWSSWSACDTDCGLGPELKRKITAVCAQRNLAVRCWKVTGYVCQAVAPQKRSAWQLIHVGQKEWKLKLKLPKCLNTCTANQ